MIETRSFGLRSGFSPLHAAAYYCMRLLPYGPLRTAISRAASARVRLGRRALPHLDPHDEESAEKACARLFCEGFADLPPLLTSDQIGDIRGFLDDKPLHDKRGRSFPVSDIPRDVRRASYSLNDILDCPHIIEVMNQPGILRIAEKYLGCMPTISSIGIHMTVPSDAQLSDVQWFHRDPDGWKFLKLFVYLTDVDIDSGPHEFIATSHKTSGRMRSLIYSDSEVLSSYGEDSMRRVLGPRGTTFMADTWGIHKGGQGPKIRLMLQIQFSILPVAKFRYRPVKVLDRMTVDRYVNRLLLA